MDSLLANYASSDDDEEPPKQQSERTPSSLFSALASPSSSSLFSSLPPPDKPQTSLPINTFNKRQNFEHEEEGIAIPKPGIKPSSSLFSSLPHQKFLSQQQPISNLSPLDPNPKRVVQFKPPAPPKPFDFDEDDEKVEEEKERKRRRESEFAAQSSSVKSFLSSIPAPRNSSTLGVLHLGSGSGRRSIIENEGLSSVSDLGFENWPGVEQNAEGFVAYDGDLTGSQQPGFDQSGGGYVNYGSYGGYETGVSQSGNAGDVSGCCSYEGYGSFGDHGQYGGTWGDGSVAAVPQTSEPVGSAMIFPRKRGKRDVPTEIVEVKQEDLTKDRPREDQTKLTGIAFGPSYQPASTKGKPSKLHKRKHQIGSLYYDMKQKEMELAERRAQGFLTKAQTQGKYGW